VTSEARSGVTACPSCRGTGRAAASGFCTWCGARTPNRLRSILEWLGLALALLWGAAWAIVYLADSNGWAETEPGGAIVGTAFAIALLGVPLGIAGAALWVIARHLGAFGLGRPVAAPQSQPPVDNAVVWRVTVGGSDHRVWVRRRASEPGTAWVDATELELAWARDDRRSQRAEIAVGGRTGSLSCRRSLLDASWMDLGLEVDGAEVALVRFK
jgi:hypothetical protein